MRGDRDGMMNDRDGNRGGGGGGRGNGRGGGRGGRGRGGYGGGGGGRGRGGGGRGRGGRGRGGGRGFRGRGGGDDLMRSAESGNRRERISVESGNLVLIDQFMLANPQFIDELNQFVDAAPEKKDEVIAKFGGSVVGIEPGTYRIERDPFAFSIMIHPEGLEPAIEEWMEKATEPKGQLFVDTRCLAMIDRELLDDSGLLEKYQQLWFSGQDKACRDLLRDNGGAVRYGFQRGGDDLLIQKIPTENVICLWPETGPVRPVREEVSEQGAADNEGGESAVGQ